LPGFTQDATGLVAVVELDLERLGHLDELPGLDDGAHAALGRSQVASSVSTSSRRRGYAAAAQ
jgi:hypothetical protein